MKKFSKVLALVLVTALLSCCLLFTGCSAKKAGVYKFESMQMEKDGVQVEIKVGEKFMGALTLTEDFMVITLNEDGTISIKASGMGDDLQTGTWTDDDKESITFTIDGDAEVCFCDGETLVLEEDELGKVTFKKSK